MPAPGVLHGPGRPLPARLRVRIVSRPPPGIAWMALTTRLTSTCWSCARVGDDRGQRRVELADQLDPLRCAARLEEVRAPRSTTALRSTCVFAGGICRAKSMSFRTISRAWSAALDDLLEVPVRLRRAGPRLLRASWREAEDAAERLVQLVGDAGRELPDGREPVGVAELLLRRGPLLRRPRAARRQRPTWRATASIRLRSSARNGPFVDPRPDLAVDHLDETARRAGDENVGPLRIGRGAAGGRRRRLSVEDDPRRA